MSQAQLDKVNAEVDRLNKEHERLKTAIPSADACQEYVCWVARGFRSHLATD